MIELKKADHFLDMLLILSSIIARSLSRKSIFPLSQVQGTKIIGTGSPVPCPSLLYKILKIRLIHATLYLILKYPFFLAVTLLNFICFILCLVFNNSQKSVNSDIAKWQLSFVI